MNLTIPSKFKLVGVYRNINTHEQLTRANHVINSKDVNNYLYCTQGEVNKVSKNKGNCHTLNL